MMLAVAAVGLALGAGLMWRRSAEFRSRAEGHAASVVQKRYASESWRIEAERGRNIAAFDRVGTDRPPGIDRAADSRHWDERAENDLHLFEITSRQAANNDEMARKYRRLARQPRLPVAPDPPFPE